MEASTQWALAAADRCPADAPCELRVALIEGHGGVQRQLERIIAGAGGFRVSGSYRTVEEAVLGMGWDPPGVALVDLSRLSGIAGIRRLVESHPLLPLLVLGSEEDDDRIFEALCAGAAGCLLQSTPAARLLEGLRDTAEGGSPMPPQLARRMVGLLRQFGPSEPADYRLTAHETRLLRMLVEGHTYKTIASECSVSVNTVAFHMKSVYEKLHVHSKSQAVAKALRSGILRAVNEGNDRFPTRTGGEPGRTSGVRNHE